MNERQLDTAGVFEAVFDIYRKQAGLLLPAALLVQLLPALVSGLLREGDVSLVVLAVAAVVTFVVNIMFQGAVVEAVNDIRDGRRDHTIGSLFRSIVPVLGALTVAAVLGGLGIAFGFLLLIVPGLVLLTWWALLGPVIVMERTRALEAFGRSRELVRGNGWRVFGVLVVMLLIQLLVGNVFQAIGESLSDDITIYSLFILIGGALTAPLGALAAAVMYLDLRKRHDTATVPGVPPPPPAGSEPPPPPPGYAPPPPAAGDPPQGAPPSRPDPEPRAPGSPPPPAV